MELFNAIEKFAIEKYGSCNQANALIGLANHCDKYTGYKRKVDLSDMGQEWCSPDYDFRVGLFKEQCRAIIKETFGEEFLNGDVINRKLIFLLFLFCPQQYESYKEEAEIKDYGFYLLSKVE